MTTSYELRHLTRKCLDAKLGGYNAWAVQSTGEKAAVALVLNRPDWLALMGYTIAEAIDRAGDEWVPHLKTVANAIKYDAERDEDRAPGAQVHEYAWRDAGIEALGVEAEQQALFMFNGHRPPEELPHPKGRLVRVADLAPEAGERMRLRANGEHLTVRFGAFYRFIEDPRSED